jgi:pimeloyl-ACP methyl ester carboxylesterase
MLFRIGRVVALAVIGLLITGTVYQFLAESLDLRSNPPPGDLVDIGGFRLHLNCVGIGSPTVIIEAGSNDFSVGWSDIQSNVAQRTQTCTYDRAGMGWSDYDSEIPLPTRVVRNLRAALINAQIQPPYVLVGHSWGGILVREFAAQHPNEVSGLVFVDSSHENQNLGRPDEIEELPVGFLKYCNAVSFVGMTRALKLRNEPWFDYPEIRAMALYRTRSCAATLESRYASSLSMAQTRLPRDLGTLPLRVLTRGVADSGTDLSLEEQAWEEAWLSFQVELARLSTNSRHQVVAGASHFIHWDRPDVIVGTIEELLETLQ